VKAGLDFSSVVIQRDVWDWPRAWLRWALLVLVLVLGLGLGLAIAGRGVAQGRAEGKEEAFFGRRSLFSLSGQSFSPSLPLSLSPSLPLSLSLSMSLSRFLCCLPSHHGKKQAARTVRTESQRNGAERR
jgi:hypothetical protein